jgi:hypothetical protein
MWLIFILFDMAIIIFAWRHFAVALPTGLVALWIHDHFGDTEWAWFVSVLVMIAGIVAGLAWQRTHEEKNK